MSKNLGNIIFLSKINKIFSYLNDIKIRKYYIIDANVLKLFFKRKNFTNFFIVKKGEKSKKISTVLKIIDFLIKKKYNKNTCIISIGGGVVGDISGFVASIFLRGVNFINIPTTLLSQVDSCIGGKNGVNSLKSKNTIGTIYFPNKIIISYFFLNKLKKKILMDGFAEILKISMINNRNLFYYIYKNKKNILKTKNIKKIILVSIKSKIKILKKNIDDNKFRLLLNFGHTFGHSIEKFFNYNLSHGRCVYIGILISTYISNLFRFLKFNIFNKVKNIIKEFFPDIKYYLKKINTDSFINNIKYDKKNFNNRIQFILIKNIGKTFIFKNKLKSINLIFSFKKILSKLVKMV
ncbi:3-dehydroquinate synthase [Candidatus Vidania fulgoroideorum]